MGSKYSSQSASGYNSSPPSDDGTQAASNQVSWATQKTKLADPIKDFADDMNTALVTAFDYSVRQISSSDSTVASDHMKCVEIAPTVTTSVTISLGDATTMTNNYRVFVKNSSAIAQTLGLVTAGDTLDGSAGGALVLGPKMGVALQVNSAATGYLVNAIYTNGQIKFPATQNASSDANTLDDYEEGSFTPAIDSTSPSYTSRSGSYTKIGRLVHFALKIVLSDKGTGTFTSITGLPFISGGSASGIYDCSCKVDSLTTSVVDVRAQIQTANTVAFYVKTAAAASYTAMVLGDLSNTTSINVTGVYEV